MAKEWGRGTLGTVPSRVWEASESERRGMELGWNSGL